MKTITLDFETYTNEIAAAKSLAESEVRANALRDFKADLLHNLKIITTDIGFIMVEFNISQNAALMSQEKCRKWLFQELGSDFLQHAKKL